MSQTYDRVSVLLKNAELLLTYNTQARILPSSNLEEAYQVAKKLPNLPFESEEAATLRWEIARVVDAMKPATLLEVQDFYPYTAENPREKTRWQKMLPYVAVVVTVPLVVICAYYTDWSKRAGRFMGEVQSAQQQLASERFNQILERWEMTPSIAEQDASEDVIRFGDEPEKDFRIYLSHFKTFTSLEERKNKLIRGYNPIKTELARWRAWRAYQRTKDQAATTDAREPLVGKSYNEDRDQQTEEDWKDQEVRKEKCLKPIEATYEQVTESARAHRVIPSESAVGTGDPIALPPLLQKWEFAALAAEKMRRAHLDAFACFFNLPRYLVRNADDQRGFYIHAIRDMRDRLDVLNSWLLPGIYGAMGALLLTLRVYVSPVLPNPSQLRTTMRLLLGAFVGIIVGWFWAPESDELFEFANLTFGLFTMAFLFGYGIDIFMNLLDRVIGTVAGAVENAGSKP